MSATPGPDPDGFDLVVKYLLAKRPELQEIDLDVDLIENRILDSLGFVDFLYLLEEHTGQQLTLDTISAEDFRTLGRIKERFFDGRI